MEQVHDNEWYEKFCQRLDEAKKTMIEMGFGDGLDELVEEMKLAALDLKNRNEAKEIGWEVENWEGEGGAVIPDTTSHNVDTDGSK